MRTSMTREEVVPTNAQLPLPSRHCSATAIEVATFCPKAFSSCAGDLAWREPFATRILVQDKRHARSTRMATSKGHIKQGLSFDLCARWRLAKCEATLSTIP